MLGGVAFRARGMIQAKALIERGVGAPQAIRAARLFGINPRRIAEGLARYSLAELRSFPAHLIEADRTLKSRMVSARAVMEALVDRMVRADRGRWSST